MSLDCLEGLRVNKAGEAFGSENEKLRFGTSLRNYLSSYGIMRKRNNKERSCGFLKMAKILLLQSTVNEWGCE